MGQTGGFQTTLTGTAQAEETQAKPRQEWLPHHFVAEAGSTAIDAVGAGSGLGEGGCGGPPYLTGPGPQPWRAEAPDRPIHNPATQLITRVAHLEGEVLSIVCHRSFKRRPFPSFSNHRLEFRREADCTDVRSPHPFR